MLLDPIPLKFSVLSVKIVFVEHLRGEMRNLGLGRNTINQLVATIPAKNNNVQSSTDYEHHRISVLKGSKRGMKPEMFPTLLDDY